MNGADAGFTLFDASSTSPGGQAFETFEKLTLEDEEINRNEPCN